MQAFSHFWMPDFMHSQSHDKMACTKPHSNPVVNIPIFSNLKRKRNDSWSSPSPGGDAPSKKQKRDTSQQRQTSATPEALAKLLTNLPDGDAPTVPVTDAVPILTINTPDAPRRNSGDPNMESDLNLTAAQRSRVMRLVQRQLDLEILYKNDELRFIEQEIAKCQIAMEQLRRCRTIPFPGQPGSRYTAQEIGEGVGPALEPPSGLSRPEHPAPYGVTDGPYTRHYARWLIPDSAFDPAPPPPPRQHLARQSVGGRSTRSVAADQTSSSRTQRSSTVSNLQSLVSNYPTPKDRNAPLVAIRPSDRKPVRLVCKKCGKDNISSMQGFLNHCRIQHKHEYTSHGQAAEECGILLEEGEIPASAGPSNELPTPVSAVIPASNRPLVHPLNAADPLIFATRVPAPTVHSEKQGNVHLPTLNQQNSGPASTRNGAKTSTIPIKVHESFVASPLAPRLSSLLQKRGLGLDLKSLVENAKDRSDFENICDQLASDDEKEDAKVSKPKVVAKAKSRRGTSQAGARPQGLHVHTQMTSGAMQTRDHSDEMRQIPLAGSRSFAGTRPSGFGDQTASPDAMSAEPSPQTSSFSHTQGAYVPHSPYLPMIKDRSSSPPMPHANTNTDNSPHTVDTNPGLITDDDDGESDDDEDAASDAASYRGVDVGVVEHEMPDVSVGGRGHDDERDHHSAGVAKSEAEGLGIRGGAEAVFRGLNGGSNVARRGRPGKGGKGKGGGKKRG